MNGPSFNEDYLSHLGFCSLKSSNLDVLGFIMMENKFFPQVINQNLLVKFVPCKGVKLQKL